MFRSADYPLKLRLNNPTHPRQIDLLNDAPDDEAYYFVGQKGS